MPLNLDIQRKFSARSDRVKNVDFHPREPWVLSALYSGHVSIWNYQTETMVKSIEISALPIRCAKFIPSKQWVVCGGDDMMIYVYNYNTMERVTSFHAHYDYIRYISVHPTLPLVLSCSDDTTVKLWNWTKNWDCIHTYEGHSHYVMQVQFNPKDANSFVSASLDRTIKFWGISSPACHYTLEGHERGVNCVAFLPSGEKPYLVSGGDDRQVRVWDYQTKKNVAILEGHTNNVSSVCYHPSLPLIISGGEDGAVRLWHSGTYKAEEVLNYGMERVWSVACLQDSSKIAIGCDDGMLLIEIGRDEPVMSMDATGKLLWARNNEILSSRIRGFDYDSLGISDGDKLPIAGKELLTCESFPHYLKHSPNGRMVATCGNGEFIIYTALSLATQHHGPALEFAWGTANGTFAARESSDKIRIYQNSQPALVFKTEQPIDAIYGGPLLAVRCGETVDLYDWTLGTPIRRLEAAPLQVVWNTEGTIMALCCKEAVYLLRYDSDLVSRTISQGNIPEEGIEGALDVVGEIEESIRSGVFAGQAFVFTSMGNKIGYAIDGEVIGLGFSESPLFALGYLSKEARVYFASARCEVVSYILPMEVIAFQEAVVRGDLELARNILPGISQDRFPKLASFLESHEHYSFALELATDPDQRFDLAIQCKDFDICVAMGYVCNSTARWRHLADVALQSGYLPIAQLAYTHAEDYSSLLLLYSMCNHEEGLLWLAKNENAVANVPNIAFTAAYLLGNVQECIRILQKSGNFAQAALFSRTYAPSHLSSTTKAWKNHIAFTSSVTANSIASPETHPHLFPWLHEAIAMEQQVMGLRSQVMMQTAVTATVTPAVVATPQTGISTSAPISATTTTPAPPAPAPVPTDAGVGMGMGKGTSDGDGKGTSDGDGDGDGFFDLSPSMGDNYGEDDSKNIVAINGNDYLDDNMYENDAFGMGTGMGADVPVAQQQPPQPQMEEISAFGNGFSDNYLSEDFNQEFPSVEGLSISSPPTTTTATTTTTTTAAPAVTAAATFTPPSFLSPTPAAVLQPVVAPTPAIFTSPVVAPTTTFSPPTFTSPSTSSATLATTSTSTPAPAPAAAVAAITTPPTTSNVYPFTSPTNTLASASASAPAPAATTSLSPTPAPATATAPTAVPASNAGISAITSPEAKQSLSSPPPSLSPFPSLPASSPNPLPKPATATLTKLSPLPAAPSTAAAAGTGLAVPAFKPLISPLPSVASLPKPLSFQPPAPLPSALPKLTSPNPLPPMPAVHSLGKPLAPLPSLAPLPKPLSGLPAAKPANPPSTASNLTKLAEDW